MRARAGHTAGASAGVPGDDSKRTIHAVPAAIVDTQMTQRIVAIARHLEDSGSAMLTMCSPSAHGDQTVIPHEEDKFYSISRRRGSLIRSGGVGRMRQGGDIRPAPGSRQRWDVPAR